VVSSAPKLRSDRQIRKLRAITTSQPARLGKERPLPSPFARHWALDPDVVFLNHGSFGACPRPVLEQQAEWRARMEREPVLFLARELERLFDEARAALAHFVGADPDDLAFVPNATSAVSTVVRSLDLRPGDELLTTTHAYNACVNALRAQERRGVRVVAAAVPFPIESPRQVVEAVLGAATSRTRLALVDHVTSPTGLVFPVGEIVQALDARGIDTLVDGAHAPGMLPLDLRALGAAYYTGNCHKWVCSPKGSAFLHVRRDRQDSILPLAIGHGYNSPRTDRSRFRLLFDRQGTADPSPYLCIPAAIRFLATVVPGGWPELMGSNRALALEARRRLCASLAIAEPAPETMIASLAAVPLPDDPAPAEDGVLPLQRELFERHRIEVPVSHFPAPPRRLLRVAAQIYNSIEEYEQLADVLRRLVS
jgi:isopenicillin-N epimerase